MAATMENESDMGNDDYYSLLNVRREVRAGSGGRDVGGGAARSSGHGDTSSCTRMQSGWVVVGVMHPAHLLVGHDFISDFSRNVTGIHVKSLRSAFTHARTTQSKSRAGQ